MLPLLCICTEADKSICQTVATGGSIVDERSGKINPPCLQPYENTITSHLAIHASFQQRLHELMLHETAVLGSLVSN